MSIAKINDVKINYQTFGDGIPLLLISGMGIDYRTWMYQIPFFEKYFKVIAFDNRGIGKSTDVQGLYGIEMMADDAAGLLKHLKISKAHIVGSSMGGMIAQELAIKHPKLVDKLVLCSTSASPHNNIKHVFVDGIQDVMGRKKVEEILELDYNRPILKKVFNHLVQQLYSERFIVENKKFIEETIREFASNTLYLETLFKQLHAVRSHNTVDRLLNIKSETLIITGTNDSLLPVECSELLTEKIPKSKLVKIENALHGFHLEKADEFNEIVLEFLS